MSSLSPLQIVAPIRIEFDISPELLDYLKKPSSASSCVIDMSGVRRRMPTCELRFTSRLSSEILDPTQDYQKVLKEGDSFIFSYPIRGALSRKVTVPVKELLDAFYFQEVETGKLSTNYKVTLKLHRRAEPKCPYRFEVVASSEALSSCHKLLACLSLVSRKSILNHWPGT